MLLNLDHIGSAVKVQRTVFEPPFIAVICELDKQCLYRLWRGRVSMAVTVEVVLMESGSHWRGYWAMNGGGSR